MRSRELIYAALAALAVSAGGCAAGFAVSHAAGVVCICLAAGLMAVFFAFTWLRYREIRRLSSYLARVYAGAEPLDIRDNREGELSILKSDIYKITSVLTRQAGQLKSDRNYLAEALENISHQLKTPLTSLFVMTDLLRRGDLPQRERDEFWRQTYEQLGRIEWLVATLLKMSRIDAGAVEFRRAPTPVTELVRKAAAPMLIPMELRGISFSPDCPEGLIWSCDPEWTAEALANILKNCVEHCSEGGSISISCAENPLHTSIIIEDDGPGFAPDDLPNLFKRFYRGHGAGGDSVGIGLAMSRAILQSQGGDITAENRREGGARFTVRLFRADWQGEAPDGALDRWRTDA